MTLLKHIEIIEVEAFEIKSPWLKGGVTSRLLWDLKTHLQMGYFRNNLVILINSLNFNLF